VYAALQTLQEAAGRCRIRHWLLRVLSARDVRLQLAAALSSMAAALQELSTSAAASVIAVSSGSKMLDDSKQAYTVWLEYVHMPAPSAVCISRHWDNTVV
jgi:short-subunit dehydrogenase involved in D-alanine esterification of teichoic acids